MQCPDIPPELIPDIGYIPSAQSGPTHLNAGGWMLLAVTIAIIVFEIWALRTHNPTISQWVKRTMGKHRWWKWLGGTILGLMLWHLIFGGPL